MVATQMAKRPAGGAGAGDKPKERKGGLKVRPEDSQLINLIAKYRRLKIELFFQEKDVQAFFQGLLKVEQEKWEPGR